MNMYIFKATVFINRLSMNRIPYFNLSTAYSTCRTPTRNYTAAPNSLLQMLTDLGLQTPAAIYKRLGELKLTLSDLPAPRVPTAVFAGVGLPTEECFYYDAPFVRGFGGPPSGIEYGDGDDSVNAVSARMPEARCYMQIYICVYIYMYIYIYI